MLNEKRNYENEAEDDLWFTREILLFHEIKSCIKKMTVL